MNGNIRSISTKDYVYEKLKQGIIELAYEPNEHLVEITLAKELGVSRTPLRQALYRLELEGLVIKKPTGRINVSPMSVQEAKEIFQVREVIEGLIAREATINISNSDEYEAIINKMQDIIYLMRKAAESKRQIDVVSYGSDFHKLLEQYGENVTAGNMLKQINNRVARYRRLGAYKDPKYPSIVPVKEHEEILRSVINKDELAAEKAMRHHIKRSLQNTVSAISYLSL